MMDATPGAGQQALPSQETNEAQSARPSLLPAFEPFSPFSSSPGLPRVAKRKFDETLDSRQQHYPTPVPTSSTGIITSSSPARQTRPGLKRTVSALSERAPLGDVPCLVLPRNGEPLLMGRSSNSSDYQFPANRHISRTHVSATYFAPDEVYPRGRVEVECLGWNGAKVHCRGDIRELAKNEVFVSDKAMAQIMVDVQSTRVMLAWPKEDSQGPLAGSRSPWAQDSPSQPRLGSGHVPSSPPIMLPSPRPATPVSPTPNYNLGDTFTETFRADSDELVRVYQDHDSEEDAPHDTEMTPEPTAPVCEGTPTPKHTVSAPKELASFASEQEEFSEHDEENDPVVHSFGPFGANLLDKLDSFHAQSPERKRKPLKASTNSPGRSASAPLSNISPVKNHVINQLAYSRIHALPLSTIHSQLPPEYRGAMAKPSDREAREILSTSDLKTILDHIPCVGEISREGKDAAGKLLESEFYYVPEMDQDVHRRDAVANSLGKTSIRAARKQHKVRSPAQPPSSIMTDLSLAILLEASSFLNVPLEHITSATTNDQCRRNAMSIIYACSFSVLLSSRIPLHSDARGWFIRRPTTFITPKSVVLHKNKAFLRRINVRLRLGCGSVRGGDYGGHASRRCEFDRIRASGSNGFAPSAHGMESVGQCRLQEEEWCKST